MIKNISRSLNLNIWDGEKRGKHIRAPASANEWLDAAFAKGYRRALADLKAAMNAEPPYE